MQSALTETGSFKAEQMRTDENAITSSFHDHLTGITAIFIQKLSCIIFTSIIHYF